MMRTTLANIVRPFTALPIVALSFVLWGWPATLPAATALPPSLSGMGQEEVLRLGEKMYRQGILPSGKPMHATVKNDVPVDGSMFTCVSCHLRSGIGTTEGKVRTPPIDGTRLYAPVSKFRGVPILDQSTSTRAGEIFRPAYTDKTLARVLETGLDPNNRQLDSVMPIYSLTPQESEIMVYYLKNLSTGLAPGVTDTTLRFATVITEEVPQEDRSAMLDSLENFIHHWKVPYYKMERAIKTYSHRQEGKARDLRTMALSVWELKGKPETWRKQLDAYFQKEPVFALLGGISTLDWSPIHRFCEDRKIPAILPVTDFPVISATDWYTLYFSKGLYQEGETAAKYLNQSKEFSAGRVVQVVSKDLSGQTLAKGFQETWTKLGHKAPETILLKDNTPIAPGFWKQNLPASPAPVVVLWLTATDFPDLDSLAKEVNPSIILASSTLVGSRLYSLADAERANLYLTYPYALPQESTGYWQSRATSGFSQDKIPPNQREAALKMQALFQTISAPLSRLRSFVYQDYFLELIESNPDLATGSIIYPRLSFGQGQRYASKGCYIVQLSQGHNPQLKKMSEWVIH